MENMLYRFHTNDRMYMYICKNELLNDLISSLYYAQRPTSGKTFQTRRTKKIPEMSDEGKK